jgi:hypothetical protein
MKYPPPEDEPDASAIKGFVSALLIYAILACVVGMAYIVWGLLTGNPQ